MGLYKRDDSRIWQYSFTVRGKRYRGSTGETNKAAAEQRVAELRTELAKSSLPTMAKRPQTLKDLAASFLLHVDGSKLEDKSKKYLRNGWRLLENAGIGGMMADKLTSGLVNSLSFPGGAYNANCALKSLRRMLHWANESGIPVTIPKITLEKEYGREIPFTEEHERAILPHCSQLLHDVIVLLRRTGMRPKRELFRMRVEHVDWNRRMIFVPDSKTKAGRRYIPMSDKVVDVLMMRCAGRTEGWVFEADSASGHIVTIDKQFRTARKAAKLPENLVLYSCRHDFGTELLKRTGNLALVMKVMGQRSIKAALEYQHPELELIRAALNGPQQELRVN